MQPRYICKKKYKKCVNDKEYYFKNKLWMTKKFMNEKQVAESLEIVSSFVHLNWPKSCLNSSLCLTAILEGIFDCSAPYNISFKIKKLMSRFWQSFLDIIILLITKVCAKLSSNSPKWQKASRSAENKPGVDKQ